MSTDSLTEKLGDVGQRLFRQKRQLLGGNLKGFHHVLLTYVHRAPINDNFVLTILFRST